MIHLCLVRRIGRVPDAPKQDLVLDRPLRQLSLQGNMHTLSACMAARVNKPPSYTSCDMAVAADLQHAGPACSLACACKSTTTCAALPGVTDLMRMTEPKQLSNIHPCLQVCCNADRSQHAWDNLNAMQFKEVRRCSAKSYLM